MWSRGTDWSAPRIKVTWWGLVICPSPCRSSDVIDVIVGMVKGRVSETSWLDNLTKNCNTERQRHSKGSIDEHVQTMRARSYKNPSLPNIKGISFTTHLFFFLSFLDVMNTENTYLTKLTTKGCFTAAMTSHSSTGVPNNINNGPVHRILRSH